MILGARESRDHQFSRAPKIIKILRLVFAGDDFAKICFQIIDEIPLILLTFWDTISICFYLIKKNKTIHYVWIFGYRKWAGERSVMKGGAPLMAPQL